MAVDGDRKKRGPYIFKIPYTIAALPHDFTFQVQCVTPPEPGTLPIDIMIRTRNGVNRTLADVAATFWGVASDLFPSDASLSQYYLERAQAGTNKLFYISSGSLSGPGTGAVHAPAREAIMTFRTAGSSVVRLNVMETARAASEFIGALTPNPLDSDVYGRIAAWVVDPLSPVLGTDATWVVAPMSVSQTQNEATYRARYRP